MVKKPKEPWEIGFSRQLLRWNKAKNRRQMPWKGEKDPYKVWLSEIILQQTRVEQGLKYYNEFVQTFPVIHQLASAPEEKVFKLWEGLG
jgi:A/G-specific adenine glycosylase